MWKYLLSLLGLARHKRRRTLERLRKKPARLV